MRCLLDTRISWSSLVLFAENISKYWAMHMSEFLSFYYSRLV
jgi:hypothetical protein